MKSVEEIQKNYEERIKFRGRNAKKYKTHLDGDVKLMDSIKNRRGNGKKRDGR